MPISGRLVPPYPAEGPRRDNEYGRCGTANVFCAVEPKGGHHFTSATTDRSAFEFARFVCDLAMQYPEAATIHLVMDNLNTHRRKSLTDTFGDHVGNAIWDRFTIHYTPKHGSWLNQAEIEISLFARQCLGNEKISGNKDPSSGSSRLESPDESSPQEDQLAI
jgi:hypothetical protein